jgi:[acyl-carrier-protein] S-malonyltransferase
LTIAQILFSSRMTDKIGLLFSGQGAQAIGMGQDLCARSPAAAEFFTRADTLLGRPLSQLMFNGPLDELTQTANCQPALFVHGLAALAALRAAAGQFPVAAAAGLSLGEFTAHAAAGTFDFETGLRLVEARGRFMEEACQASSGAMAALIGADENVVRDLAAETDVDIANLNSPGQIVISGEAERVTLAISMAKQSGIRKATLLNVAGAYHSRLMNPAYEKLGEKLLHTILHEPNFPVISNVDARPVGDFDDIRRTLTEQVTGTVCWTQSVEYLVDEIGCTLFLELGPGNVLAGLVRRIRPGVPVLGVQDSSSLAIAVERLNA